METATKVPTISAGPYLKDIPPPAKQTYHIEQKQHRHEKNKTKRKESARHMARQQPRQKATTEQQRKSTQGMSEPQVAEEYSAVCESFYIGAQTICAIMLFCLNEKDMRSKTTNSRDSQRRSDSNNTRKQRPSRRIQCLRDECKRQGVDKYSGACETFNIDFTEERNYACAHHIRFNKKEQSTSSSGYYI